MHLLKKLLIIPLLASLSFCAFAQRRTTRIVTKTTDKSDQQITTAINKAESYFKRGQLELKNNRREQARDQFDKAVDAILDAGLDVRSYPRLREYYVQLTERIYREEVPLQPSEGSAVIGLRQQSYKPTENDTLLQSPTCTIGITGVPALRGFRLGSEQKDASALLPTGYASLWADKGYGLESITVSKLSLKDGPGATNLNTISLMALDHRIVSIRIEYESTVSSLFSPREFATKISESLKLPDAWAVLDAPINKQYALNCVGFSVVTDFQAGTSVTMIVPTILATINKRKTEEKERQRQAFKP